MKELDDLIKKVSNESYMPENEVMLSFYQHLQYRLELEYEVSI